jgi:hypothetical protein
MSPAAVVANVICLPLGLITLVFLPVGRLDWKPGWIFIAFLVAAFGTSFLILARVNPSIYRARSRFQPGTKRWDLILVPLIFAAMITEVPLAAFDAGRMAWSSMPMAFVMLGATLCLALELRSAPGLKQSTPSSSLASECNASAANKSLAKGLMPSFATQAMSARL